MFSKKVDLQFFNTLAKKYHRHFIKIISDKIYFKEEKKEIYNDAIFIIKVINYTTSKKNLLN